MEQIYYTQCPIGYGLGASNGFQIKRISSGYPTSSDFRFWGCARSSPEPASRRRARFVIGRESMAWPTSPG